MAYEYNDNIFGINWMATKRDAGRVLDRRRLSEAWAKWHYYLWCKEMGLEVIVPKNIDMTLKFFLPHLRAHFTCKWSGNYHGDKCGSKGN